MTEQILEALRTSAGMLWKALWALVFGYLISAGIQVLVTRTQMASALGERGAKQAALGGFFGFVSSSCSFAALAASRSVLVKGAHPVNALAFLIASTNLVLELGLVLLVLLTWHFFVGNLLLGIFMIAYAYLLSPSSGSRSDSRSGRGTTRSGNSRRPGTRWDRSCRRR